MRRCSLIVLLLFSILLVGFCSACSKKKPSIKINYKSQVSSSFKGYSRDVPSSMIYLGDETKVDFTKAVGPSDISTPSFKMVNVASP